MGDSVDPTGSKKKIVASDRFWFRLRAAPKNTSHAVLLHVFRLIVT
jgi:hypothetical protein